MQVYRRLLCSKRFLPLFITQFFGALNDNAFKSAFLIWLIYDAEQHSGMDASMMVTLASGAFILPFFLFSATAGQIADKYEQSALAVRIRGIEIILMVAAAACFLSASAFALLGVLFLMGMQSAFFGPIKYSLLPKHLKLDELTAGNGLIGGATFLAILLGTIYGSLVIRTEYGTPLLVSSLIAVAMMGWLASRSIPAAPSNAPDLKVGWNIVIETWGVIAGARKQSTIWSFILSISWFWLIGALFLTQLPVYSRVVIGADEQIVSYFLCLFSLGIGLGSIGCRKLLGAVISTRLVPHACLGMSISIGIMTVASWYYALEHSGYLEQRPDAQDSMLELSEFFAVGLSSWGISAGLLLLAVCAGFYVVPLYSRLQHDADRSHLARMIAANNIINALFMVCASVSALILLAFDFTPTDIFFTLALVNMAAFFRLYNNKN